MSRSKTERLLNLVICLLAAPRYLTREEIRRAVPGYGGSDEAFERAFERDKDELRRMGVPVETGSNSAVFDDEVGYRIRREAYALPEVSFTPEEMAVLSLAARAWQQATLASAASSALLKLQAYADPAAADLPGSGAAVPGVEPRVAASEPAFAPLWEAVRDRVPVRFDYRRPQQEPRTRTVEPWGIVSWHGHWYLVGHDRDRDDARVFRLSRIQGAVHRIGPPGSVVVPEGVDVRRMVASDSSVPSGLGTAVVRLRPGAGGYLRRAATTTAAGPEGWDLVELPYGDVDLLAQDVAALGPAAVVEQPPELREAVVRRVRAVLS